MPDHTASERLAVVRCKDQYSTIPNIEIPQSGDDTVEARIELADLTVVFGLYILDVRLRNLWKYPFIVGTALVRATPIWFNAALRGFWIRVWIYDPAIFWIRK